MHVLASVPVMLALARMATASCAYGTSLHRRAEGEVAVSNFSYTGTTGPTNWLSLSDANTACATGTRQSPIDMTVDTFTLVEGSTLNISFIDMPNGTQFENLGTTVEVVAEGGGSMSIPNVGDFTLQQFHFHLPSEHLDNGTSIAMELHTVWEDAKSQIAVVAAYIQLVDDPSAIVSARAAGREARRSGLDDRQSKNITTSSSATVLLETVLNSVTDIAEPGTATQTQPLVMSELANILADGQFQSYTGSLTTPPCTEGVNWMVSTQKLSIQRSTFVKVRDVVGFNARFPQNTLGETNLLQVSSQTSSTVSQSSLTQLIVMLLGSSK